MIAAPAADAHATAHRSPQQSQQDAPSEQSDQWASHSDGQLLQAYFQRDREAALVELLRRHGPAMLAAARRKSTVAADADDAVQMAVLALLRDGRTLREGSLGGWLHTATVRAAGKLARKRARLARRHQKLRELQPEVVETDWAAIAEAATLATLDDELAELPDRWREPLVLKYLSGLSVIETAERLGISVSATEGRLKRAREALRGRLVRRGVSLAVLVAAARPTVSAAATFEAPQVVTQAQAASVSMSHSTAVPAVAPLSRTSMFTTLTTAKAAALSLMLVTLPGSENGLASDGQTADFGQTAGQSPVAGAAAAEATPTLSTEWSTARPVTQLAMGNEGSPRPSEPKSTLSVRERPENSATDEERATAALQAAIAARKEGRLGDAKVYEQSLTEALQKVKTTEAANPLATGSPTPKTPKTPKKNALPLGGFDGGYAPSPPAEYGGGGGDGGGMSADYGAEYGGYGDGYSPPANEAAPQSVPASRPVPGAVTTLPAFTEAEQTLNRTLATVVSPEFDEVPLTDALQFLRDFAKAEQDFRLDVQALDEAGIPLDEPVSLTMTGPLEAVLNRLLEPLSLEYGYVDGVLMVSASGSLAEHTTTQIYPIPEALKSLDETSNFGAMDFGGGGGGGYGVPRAKGVPGSALAEILQEHTIALSEGQINWAATSGGDHVITPTPLGLIVTTSWRGHREIRKLLKQLGASEPQESKAATDFDPYGGVGGYGGGYDPYGGDSE